MILLLFSIILSIAKLCSVGPGTPQVLGSTMSTGLLWVLELMWKHGITVPAVSLIPQESYGLLCPGQIGSTEDKYSQQNCPLSVL